MDEIALIKKIQAELKSYAEAYQDTKKYEQTQDRIERLITFPIKDKTRIISAVEAYVEFQKRMLELADSYQRAITLTDQLHDEYPDSECLPGLEKQIHEIEALTNHARDNLLTALQTNTQNLLTLLSNL